jgi:limonene-1,2-epoxide hydrolase
LSRELIESFMSDLEQRDVEKLRRWFFSESVLWMPPVGKIDGDRRILAAFRIIFRGYSDIHWKVTNIMSAGNNRFIYETESWGTIGKSTPYQNHILTIIDFDAQGRIVFLSDYFKDTAIFNAEKKTAVTEPTKLAVNQ